MFDNIVAGFPRYATINERNSLAPKDGTAVEVVNSTGSGLLTNGSTISYYSKTENKWNYLSPQSIPFAELQEANLQIADDKAILNNDLGNPINIIGEVFNVKIYNLNNNLVANPSNISTSENVVTLNANNEYDNFTIKFLYFSSSTIVNGVVITERAIDTAVNSGGEKAVTGDGIYQKLLLKQDKLISGTNIRTINGNSLLGSGNLSIVSSGGSSPQEDGFAINGILTPTENQSVTLTVDGHSEFKFYDTPTIDNDNFTIVDNGDGTFTVTNIDDFDTDITTAIGVRRYSSGGGLPNTIYSEWQTVNIDWTALVFTDGTPIVINQVNINQLVSNKTTSVQGDYLGIKNGTMKTQHSVLSIFK